MTMSEYTEYINNTYNDQTEKGNYNVVFDKPVRFVEENYRTDALIKQMHLKVIKSWNSYQILKKLHKYANFKETSEYSEYNDNLYSLSRFYFGDECKDLICNLQPNSTLTFKNLTFADYYMEFKFSDGIFSSNDKPNFIFENVDFNYIKYCYDFMYGNNPASFTLKNVKMYCVKEFNAGVERITYDHVEAPNLNFIA